MTEAIYNNAGPRSCPPAAMLLLLALAAFLRNGVWHEDPNVWLDAVRKSPNKARTYTSIAAAYELQGRIPDAIAAYEQATRLRPDYFVVGAHVNLGVLYFSQGAVDRAIAQYEQALRLDPNRAEAYNNLGNALLKRGDVFRALDRYRDAIRSRPDYVEAYYNLGLTYYEQGALEPARSALERTLRLKHDHQDAARLLKLIASRR